MCGRPQRLIYNDVITSGDPVGRAKDTSHVVAKIVDSWSKFLGFTEKPVAQIRSYNVHNLPAGTTLEQLVNQIAGPLIVTQVVVRSGYKITLIGSADNSGALLLKREMKC